VSNTPTLAPNEGEADTPEAIADELCEALLAFDHVDYNALTQDELRDLLEARETVGELCTRYRRQQKPRDTVDGGEEA
jgi:hypothetical protein